MSMHMHMCMHMHMNMHMCMDMCMSCVTRPHGSEVYARSRVPNRDHHHTTTTKINVNTHIYKCTHIYIYMLI